MKLIKYLAIAVTVFIGFLGWFWVVTGGLLPWSKPCPFEVKENAAQCVDL